VNTQLQTATLALLALLVIGVFILAIYIVNINNAVAPLAGSPVAHFIAGIGAS
jgi:hypothetical protein